MALMGWTASASRLKKDRSCAKSPPERVPVGESSRGNRIGGTGLRASERKSASDRVSERVSEREGLQRLLRGFERFSEVLRGFQRFLEVFRVF